MLTTTTICVWLFCAGRAWFKNNRSSNWGEQPLVNLNN